MDDNGLIQEHSEQIRFGCTINSLGINLFVEKMLRKRHNGKSKMEKINNCSINHGTMVVSLDFELMWGIMDSDNPLDYRFNIEGVNEVVPILLNIFKEYSIHATWGIVGMMAYSSVEECVENMPAKIPQYRNRKLSSYEHFEQMKDYNSDYLFASKLIQLIVDSNDQELGSHTYSHYYCAEEGQSESEFIDDLIMAKRISNKYGINLNSIIFPRNQINTSYTTLLKQYGIKNYRGNENIWFNRIHKTNLDKNLVRRAFRLIDNYINISGPQCYPYSEIKDSNGLNNIRSSRFFRPYSVLLSLLEPLRLARIKGQMTYAAKNKQVFHLWWHPHNFGKNIDKNIENLRCILNHYEKLHEKYGFTSMNMEELGELIQ